MPIYASKMFNSISYISKHRSMWATHACWVATFAAAVSTLRRESPAHPRRPDPEAENPRPRGQPPSVGDCPLPLPPPPPLVESSLAVNPWRSQDPVGVWLGCPTTGAGTGVAVAELARQGDSYSEARYQSRGSLKKKCPHTQPSAFSIVNDRRISKCSVSIIYGYHWYWQFTNK